MEKDEYIDLCNDALNSVRDLLPEKDYNEAKEYINKYDEWGIGIELALDAITEENIEISEEQFAIFKTAMDAMGLGDSDRIKHVKNNNVR